jgi:hypothetical protein
MSKITDTNFYLPEVYPVIYHQNFINSANKPLLITGVEKQNGAKDDFVVKLRSAERMSSEAFMRELLGAFIALELEIAVVKPVIIDVGEEFLELLKGHDCWVIAGKSIGYNYGSQYIRGYNAPVLNQTLSDKLLPFAQNIFAFDLLIQNMDRTEAKPNMLTNGEEIVILDHEIAFGFVFDFLLKGSPGEFSDSDHHWIGNHCLLSLIKGKSFDFENFSVKLERLNDDFWNKAWEFTPDDWKNKDQFDKIKNFISGVRDNRNIFIQELKKIMS